MTRLAVFILAVAVFGGCQEPPVVSMGSALTQGAVTATVTGVELRYVDLEGPRGAVQTAEPVLLLTLDVTNAGTEPILYDMGWSATMATQAQSALLFADPGAEINLPTMSNISALQLQSETYLADPVTESTRIAPGETLTDVMLFEAPAAGTSSLLLSLPPSMFGATVTMPGYVRIPFSAPAEVPAPEFLGQGDTFEGDGFTFTVTGTEAAYVPLAQSISGDEGFTSSPLYKVMFRIENTGETSIEYIPVQANRGMDAPALFDQDGAPIERASMPDGVRVTDETYVTERRVIAPGESLSSYLLFRQPPSSTTGLRLFVPGKRMRSTGLVRVALDYAHREVPLPEELRPAPAPTPTPAPTEDGE